ncbi:YeiH family protein [Oceaniradius stylonematis]|uniref:YeiH family protein n=1 Tax=Oceaniradius stylonematis TaxID=2184161 RepID=UPI00273DA9E4|nr:putative sulfate exporter family transporter [Oceaniradius stylonematis]
MLAPFAALRHGYRGLIVVVTVALCAGFLSDHYGAPVMLFALLIGMAFHFLADNEQCKGGIDFAAKTLLRMGVALLGFRLSFGQVAEQGWLSVAVIVGLVVMTIASGWLFAPVLKRSTQLGLLTGGAVAICGASAALAIAAAMPRRAGLDQDTLFTVVAVTTLSTVAMIAYPIVFSMLGYTDLQAGFLIGATIHDVAQVVGAGYSISDEAGNMATLTKLKRVLLLPLVIIAIAVFFRAPEANGVGVPLFVVMFIVFMAINSLGVLPEPFVAALVETSRWMLIAAIAALGVKTSLGAMVGLGGRHVALVCLQTILLLAAAMAIVSFIGP